MAVFKQQKTVINWYWKLFQCISMNIPFGSVVAYLWLLPQKRTFFGITITLEFLYLTCKFCSWISSLVITGKMLGCLQAAKIIINWYWKIFQCLPLNIPFGSVVAYYLLLPPKYSFFKYCTCFFVYVIAHFFLLYLWSSITPFCFLHNFCGRKI